jgi:outer membrane protein insertion porin family
MKFKIFFLLFFAAAILSFSQNANDEEWYQGKPIRDIVFSGLRNISHSELEALMQPYKGRLFNDSIFWEIQGKLYALEYFERIDPATVRWDTAGSEVIIRFTVVERPVVGRINFTGNSNIRNRELLNVLTTRVNDVYNQAKVRVDIEAIVNLYIEKGYPNVSVTVNEAQVNDSTIYVTFHVNEQDRIIISRIEFQGNTRFSNFALKNQLSLKAKSLLNNGAFNEAKLIADREAIVKYYHDRGFIDAIVRDVTRTFDTNERGTNMVLTFLIDEGSQYRFGGITFEGNNIFTTEQLSRLVTSRVGDILNATRLEGDMQRISELYSTNGYIYNSIIRTPERDTQTNTISYNVSIVERGRAYIESIIITGNEKTRDYVILREIPLEPGDVFSYTKIVDSIRNLYGLQFFSNVYPDMLQGSAENLMDLVINLEEQSTTTVQLGITFSGSTEPGAFPLSGMIQWNDRNLAGTGNELGVDLTSSVLDSTNFSVNYLHRWIFGLPFSLGVNFAVNYVKRQALMANNHWWFNGDETYAFPDGFASYYEYISNSKLPPGEFLMPYEQLYLSFGLSSGYRWSTFMGSLNINGGLRFGIIRNTYDEIYRPFDPTLRDRNNLWTPKNSLWATLSLDQRDIYYDPTKGYYLQQRFGLYGIFNIEREHYIRTDTKAQYFLKLLDIPVTDNWSFKTILAVNTGISFIFKQPGRDTGSRVPSIEDGNKLSVDGMFVGRGWSSAVNNKGLLLLDNWIELRFPLVPNILAFDFFLDIAGVETIQGYYFGTNSQGNKNVTIENMLFSFGGGFRFTIPQFPIRISLAKRFRIIDGEVAWESGALFGDSRDPAKGVDLVISFNITY